MVKLFIGNLPREATEQEIRSLFEQYGKVMECDIIKNYGFVHIEDKTAAEDATRNLHHHKLHGVCINVEASKNKSKASTKLHVGSISPTCTNLELRAKFEEYGPVIECDIVKDYAFVHMERAEDAVEAIRGLDNTEFQDFCWMCLGDWKTHGSEYYECSRYKENPDIVNQSQQAQAREALKKYLFYFERWENHNKSLQLEAQTYQRIQEKIQERVMNNLGTWIDWQYLQNAAKLLAKCRYTLQYTYPYAYYMESGPRKKLVPGGRRVSSNR